MRQSPILDLSGQPMQPVAYGDRPWNSASQGRELRKWNPLPGSADADAMFDVGTTRARARDLDRNEALARGFLDSATGSVVSTGLSCKPNPNWSVLGKSPEWAKARRQHLRDVLLP